MRVPLEEGAARGRGQRWLDEWWRPPAERWDRRDKVEAERARDAEA
ncbi:MAG: hypothetical protein ACREM1_10780 [Longimicrobiales bacterium]